MTGPSVFLSSGDGNVGEIFELSKGCQGHIRGSRRKVGFLSRCCSRKRPHLTLRGESPGFSPVATANLGFLSSYDVDLTEPLVWPQENPVSMRVMRRLSGLLSSRCWILGPHLEMRTEPQASTPVLTWISVFLWSFNRVVRPRLLWRHASPHSS